MILFLVCAGIVVGLGFLARWLAKNVISDHYYTKDVTRTEIIIGVVICMLIVVPSVLYFGTKMARSNQLEYKEFWGGYELSVHHDTVPCHRDGPCVHEYNCDPYNHVHVSTSTDSNGNTTTHYDNHTHYHDCPYVTEEHVWRINTTLDEYTVGDHWFSENPVEWRAGSGIPSVPRGTPQLWADAEARLAADDPGPVTAIRTYDNYILASQKTILKEYSDLVEEFKSFLPAPASVDGVYNYYYANKFYQVGSKEEAGQWQQAVMRFNAAFGVDLQGDLHLVFVKRDVDPDQFTNALNAYWTSETFGKKAISKNTLVVVIGTNGRTVQWSRAFTGMPLGNELLLTRLRSDLKGLPLEPDALLGRPVGVIKNGDIGSIKNGDGAIEDLVWSKDGGFKRVCMTCKEEGGAGFGYLGSEIQPTTGQKVWMVVIATFLTAIVWAVLVAVGTTYGRDRY